jgi:hypothetical protein
MYADPTATTTLSGTQAAGSVSAAVQRPFRGGHYARHQLAVEVVSSATGAPATPAAGTLTVKARVPGAGQFAKVADIVLTAPAAVLVGGLFEAIEASSTGLDADKTWRLIVVSGD